MCNIRPVDQNPAREENVCGPRDEKYHVIFFLVGKDVFPRGHKY